MMPIKIFVCYSHMDKVWVEGEQPHGLMPWLQRQLNRHYVEIWWDNGIHAGDDFKKLIFEKIDESQIAILLFSNNIAGSDFILDIELPRIRQRYEEKKLTILPILISPLSDLTRELLDWVLDIQMVPSSRKGLNAAVGTSEWPEIQTHVLNELYRRVNLLRAHEASAQSPPPAAERPESELESEPISFPSTFWSSRTAKSPKPGGGFQPWISGIVVLALIFIVFLVVKPGTTGPTARSPWENSLGMKFVPVEGINSLFSIWVVRVQDYQAFVSDMELSWGNPSFQQGSTHPAVNITWDEANKFCDWLTQQERRAGKITSKQMYRLPTDEEWSIAVGLTEEVGKTPAEKSGNASTKECYPWGAEWPPRIGAGNYDQSLKVDEFEYTSPVGSFPANHHGLYDLGGNVWQWCEDSYDSIRKEERVLRGASWGGGNSADLLSTTRGLGKRDLGYQSVGFRCVLVGE